MLYNAFFIFAADLSAIKHGYIVIKEITMIIKQNQVVNVYLKTFIRIKSFFELMLFYFHS